MHGGSIFFIDNNEDLWVYGSNTADNKFGLTEDQLIDYNSREAMKVDLSGKKASRVFSGVNSTFIITTDNCLLAAGTNNYYQLGLGHNNKTTKFEQVQISNVANIEKIYCSENESLVNIIRFKDNTFYAAGVDNQRYTINSWKNYTKFEQIWNGSNGLPDIDQDIKEFSWTCQCVILKKDGTLWYRGYEGYVSGGLTTEQSGNFKKYELSNIKAMYPSGASGILLVTQNDECYMLGVSKNGGLDYSNDKAPTKMILPDSIKIQEIYNRDNGFLILTDQGKLYGTGLKTALGLNAREGGYTDSIIKLEMENISTLYSDNVDMSYNNAKSILLLEKDGKFYTTGNSTLMFGNDILQKEWSLVAQNVKFFSGKGSVYVDRENNLWVAGDSRYLGLGERSETYENILNYIKCTDTNIAGKVDKCYAVGSLTYVLLNNKELWCTGLYTTPSVVKQYPGWEGTENKITFTKVLDDIVFFAIGDSSYQDKIAIKSSGEAYAWGQGNIGTVGFPGWVSREMPEIISLPDDIKKAENILEVKIFSNVRSIIISKSGRVFYTGTHTSAWDGGHTSTDTFSEYTHNLTLNAGEKIIGQASADGTTALFLTDSDRVFGYGPENKLGIGKTTTNKVETALIKGLEGKNITQIVAGTGYYIAIDTDGRVYGTGSNSYGILGRWKGGDRKSPNSRYKTAFEWVECPELEI